MWVEDVLTPSGPESPAVYWFRRGVAIVVVILLLWVLWPSGGGDNKGKTGATGSTGTPGSSASPTPTTTTPTNTSNNAACTLNDVSISADADGSDYTAGQVPKVTISIRNITSGATAHACILQTSDRYLTITSGSDLWFSSKACQTAPSQPVTVEVGKTVTSSYTWNRKRQAKDCTTGGEATIGTYLAKAHLGSKETQGAVIRLVG